MIIEQQSDKNLGPIYDYLKHKRLPENDQKARHVIIESEFYDLHNDVLYRLCVHTYAKNNSHYKYCLALPQTFEETVIRYFHDKGHFAHWKMLTAIRQRYYFTRMRSKLEYFVKNCEICQSYKNPRKEHKQCISETSLTDVFARWNVDLKGPIFHRDNNYRYILVMIENTTRYMELAPLLDCTTNTIMKAFYDTIVLRHGPPKIIAIDRASYFRSQQMQTVAKLLNCDLQYFYSHVHISAGKIESHIRLVASQLGKVCKDYPDKWHTIIPAVQHAHNIFPSLATNFSPHFLVYGREMTDHLQRLFDVETELTIPETTQDIVRQINASRDTAIEVLHQNHAEYSSHSSATYNRHLKPDKYELLQPVYLKTVNHDRSRSPALQKRWIGPYYIREFLGKTACRISKTINGDILKTPFHLNLLKPAYIRHIKDDLTPVLNLDNLDPQDIPRLQITTNKAKVTDTNSKTPKDTPLHDPPNTQNTPLKSAKAQTSDIPPLIQTDQTHVKQKIDMNQQDATKHTHMPDKLYKKPIAKKYHKGDIVILYQDEDPDQHISNQNNSWIPLKDTNLSKKELSQLPWRTLSGRNTAPRF